MVSPTPIWDQVVIGTKFGHDFGPTGKQLGLKSLNSRPEYIKQIVEGSLQRLRVETIDLFYQQLILPTYCTGRSDRSLPGSPPKPSAVFPTRPTKASATTVSLTT
jgi:aryl-alcohol dehydrogenase-like predicted oxidoreductase